MPIPRLNPPVIAPAPSLSFSTIVFAAIVHLLSEASYRCDGLPFVLLFWLSVFSLQMSLITLFVSSLVHDERFYT